MAPTPRILPAPCILIVEDSVLVAMAVEAVLADRGYEVIVAGSLASARQRLRQGTIAAALLDVNLPDGNTLELASEFTALGIPIAICTGVDSGSALTGYPAAMRFEKPIEPERLADWVDSVVRPVQGSSDGLSGEPQPG